MEEKKCAIYTRVSTAEQESSIQNQQEYFKQYYKRYDCEIYKIYTDEAFSGTESKKRASFQQMLADGKEKKFDLLFAKSYSRFGRNQRETLSALAELFAVGIRIIFVEDGLDSQRDKGQFGLFAWLAEQESRKISERIKLTWQYYNKEGKIHVTTAPHGYLYDQQQGNFMIKEQEAEVVRYIYSLYEKGNGIHKIAALLNDAGYQTKNACTWSPFVVRNILTNEFYTGSLVQGKRQTIDVTIKKLEKIKKNQWIIHKNHHEAIISASQFQAVQKLYEKRSQYACQQKKSRYSTCHLFSNLIYCKLCGSACTYRESRGIGVYTCRCYEQNGRKGSGHPRNAVKESLLLSVLQQELQTVPLSHLEKLLSHHKEKLPKIEPSDLKCLEKKIAEKASLSLQLSRSYQKGLLGELQYQLQNQLLEKELQELAAKKLTQLSLTSSDHKSSCKMQQQTFSKRILQVDPLIWTNEMMKLLIERIDIAMPNQTLDFTFLFQKTV